MLVEIVPWGICALLECCDSSVEGFFDGYGKDAGEEFVCDGHVGIVHGIGSSRNPARSNGAWCFINAVFHWVGGGSWSVDPALSNERLSGIERGGDGLAGWAEVVV